MSKIEWSSWEKAVPVCLEDRDLRARTVVEELEQTPNFPFHFILSGDTLTLALRSSDGTVRVYDCRLRRVGEVESAPTEGESMCQAKPSKGPARHDLPEVRESHARQMSSPMPGED